MKMINIGYNNYVSQDKVLAVIRFDSAPAKRMVQEARSEGTFIDATVNNKTRSIIVTEGNCVIASAISTDSLSGRINKEGE